MRAESSARDDPELVAARGEYRGGARDGGERLGLPAGRDRFLRAADAAFEDGVQEANVDRDERRRGIKGGVALIVARCDRRVSRDVFHFFQVRFRAPPGSQTRQPDAPSAVLALRRRREERRVGDDAASREERRRQRRRDERRSPREGARRARAPIAQTRRRRAGFFKTRRCVLVVLGVRFHERASGSASPSRLRGRLAGRPAPRRDAAVLLHGEERERRRRRFRDEKNARHGRHAVETHPRRVRAFVRLTDRRAMALEDGVARRFADARRRIGIRLRFFF